MSRKFQDENFLVWEVYPSASRHGFSENPHLIFNCLTDRFLRPRALQHGDDEADAERLIRKASPGELIELLRQSTEVD